MRHGDRGLYNVHPPKLHAFLEAVHSVVIGAKPLSSLPGVLVRSNAYDESATVKRNRLWRIAYLGRAHWDLLSAIYLNGAAILGERRLVGRLAEVPKQYSPRPL